MTAIYSKLAFYGVLAIIAAVVAIRKARRLKQAEEIDEIKTTIYNSVPENQYKQLRMRAMNTSAAALGLDLPPDEKQVYAVLLDLEFGGTPVKLRSRAKNKLSSQIDGGQGTKNLRY